MSDISSRSQVIGKQWAQIEGLQALISDKDHEIDRLRAALKPFADLYERRWLDKADAVRRVEAGHEISELQAIRLRDVLEARRALEPGPWKPYVDLESEK